MDRRELLARLYIIIKQLWQNYKLPENELEDDFMFDLFKGFDFKIIQSALISYAKDSSFFEPAKVVARCEDILTAHSRLEEIVTEQDILQEINKAIVSIGTYDERFNNLSDVSKRIVGSPSQLYQWGQVEISTFDTVISSSILRTARQLLEQKEKIEKNNKIKNAVLGFEDKKLIE